jgi:hypothetical protein
LRYSKQKRFSFYVFAEVPENGFLVMIKQIAIKSKNPNLSVQKERNFLKDFVYETSLPRQRNKCQNISHNIIDNHNSFVRKILREIYYRRDRRLFAGYSSDLFSWHGYE